MDNAEMKFQEIMDDIVVLVKENDVSEIQRIAYILGITDEEASDAVMRLIETGDISCDDVVAPE